MRPDEASSVSALAREVFSEFVAPLYSEEGREEFTRFSEPRNLLSERHEVLVAEDAARHELAGMLMLRDLGHIAMLFVKKPFHRQGIGKQLIEQAEHLCRTRSVHELTVNAAPNSVAVYHAYGFKAVDREREVHGVRFTPMEKPL